jgi:hypothetical protein
MKEDITGLAPQYHEWTNGLKTATDAATQYSAWVHGVVKKTLAGYRDAVIDGDEALMIVALLLCDRWRVVRPDWLEKKAADWAVSQFKGDQIKKNGRPLDVAAQLETYWTYELLRHMKRERTIQGNLQEMTADVMNIASETARKRIKAAKRYVKIGNHHGSQMVAFSRLIDDMPLSRVVSLSTLGE